MFTFFWLTGDREVLKGDTPANALTLHGYGNGAVSALDFYADGDNNEYKWDDSQHSWVRREPNGN